MSAGFTTNGNAPHLQVLCADRGHVGDAQHEADGVQDVGFAAAVEAGNRVEALVPATRRQRLCNLNPLSHAILPS
jgi:hypothetical protein